MTTTTLSQLPPPPFDLVSAIGMIVMVALVIGIATWRYVRHDRKRLPGILGLWVVLLGSTGIFAQSGLLLDIDRRPPPFLFVFLVVFTLPFLIGGSRVGQRLARENSLMWLIGFQAFRLPLEVVMHHAAQVGVAPKWLTFAGYNFDIVTGATALLLALWLWRKGSAPRPLLWAFNLMGIGFLVIIAVIAIAGSPMIQAFGDAPEQVNRWVLVLPYVWLPTVLVVLAIIGHIALTRKLLMLRPPKSAGSDRRH